MVQQVPTIIKPVPQVGLKIVVTGLVSRTDNVRFVYRNLNMLQDEFQIAEVVHEGNTPLAKIVASWARDNGLIQTIFPSFWGQTDKTKNERFLSVKPDLVVLFTDGQGDPDMLRRVMRAKIKVWEPK